MDLSDFDLDYFIDTFDLPEEEGEFDFNYSETLDRL